MVGWSVGPKKDMKINGVRAEYELPCTKASGGSPHPLALTGVGLCTGLFVLSIHSINLHILLAHCQIYNPNVTKQILKSEMNLIICIKNWMILVHFNIFFNTNNYVLSFKSVVCISQLEC